MKLFNCALLLVSIPTATATCCNLDSAKVGSNCCNIFGCHCSGPCWNAGCKTICGGSDHPDRPIACPGNNKHYSCCPSGSSCIPDCEATTLQSCCCVTGKDEQIISITDVSYDFKHATKGPSSALAVSIKYQGSNAGSSNNPVGKITSSITNSQTTAWHWQSATKIGVTVKVKAGVPFFGEGEFSTTVEETFTYGESGSKSVTSSVAIDTGSDSIPAYSYQSYQFDANMVSFKIPFHATATSTDQCGNTNTKLINGIATLDGVAQFVSGNFTKVAGPAIPIECNSPFDTPIALQKYKDFCSKGSKLCKDNALCVRYGFSNGVCCAEGDMKPCCAYAEAHPSCLTKGFKKNDVLCPSPPGNSPPCCNDKLAESTDEIANPAIGDLFHFEIEQQQQVLTKEQAEAQAKADKLVCVPNGAGKTQNRTQYRSFRPAVPVTMGCGDNQI